jgi:hypothetical protein
MSSHQCLPQAQAAVAGGDFRVSKDFEAVGTEPGCQMLEQIHILESAAGKTDAVELA